MTDLSDETILALAGQGDSESFGLLYERYVSRIYSYVYYRTGNPYDAEDLTARVFFRAMHHITSYQDRGLPFSAWLYRIAHNLVANWHRDNSRRPEIPLDDTLMSPLTGWSILRQRFLSSKNASVCCESSVDYHQIDSNC